MIEYHYIVVKYRFLVYFLEDNGRLVFLYQFFTPSQKDGEEYKDPEEKGADGSRYRDPQSAIVQKETKLEMSTRSLHSETGNPAVVGREIKGDRGYG